MMVSLAPNNKPRLNCSFIPSQEHDLRPVSLVYLHQWGDRPSKVPSYSYSPKKGDPARKSSFANNFLVLPSFYLQKAFILYASLEHFSLDGILPNSWILHLGQLDLKIYLVEFSVADLMARKVRFEVKFWQHLRTMRKKQAWWLRTFLSALSFLLFLRAIGVWPLLSSWSSWSNWLSSPGISRSAWAGSWFHPNTSP